MDGFVIGTGDSYIEKVKKQNSTELYLLAKGDGMEVILQHIRKNKIFYIYSNETGSSMEFFYMLKGLVIYDNGFKKHLLKEGDYFYISQLTEPVYFKTESDVSLLWVSSEPVFYHLSQSINERIQIVKEIQKKDQYTFEHSERVQQYSLKIAERLRLPKMTLDNLMVASLLHDIGKVHTPAEILNKPGKLTAEEYEIIKRHPIDGRNMVKGTYYDKLGDIIYQHHERLDGSGYPCGIKGNDILIEAKIIAVTDSFDTMVEDRPYRKAISPSDAYKELECLSGILYEKEIVQALGYVLREEGVI